MEKNNDLIDILIVEDDAIVSKLHKFAMGSLVTNEIILCRDGKEAIEHLDLVQDTNRKTLVLLDLNMPVMNGWDFLEALQARSYAGRIYVIIVTSSLFTGDFEKAGEFDRVCGYYIKPVKQEQIMEILRLKEIAPFIDPPVQ